MAAAYHEDEWHTLVHVCQKWRSVAFASPCRLGLRLLCSEGRLAKKTLEAWPALPIIVKDYYAENLQLEHVNVLDMLKYKDRICEVNIQFVPGPLIEGIAAIKVPLPALTSLTLQSKYESAPALPDSFFGGSAQLLQELSLNGVPSPAVRNLLLSTKVLVSLRLWNIPPSGYISPEEMVNSLSELTNLKIPFLGFRSPRPQTDTETASRHSPLLTRIVLPALTTFHFKGNGKYLDDFVAQIDAPLLDNISITLFNQLIFDTPQLSCFLGRTERFNVAHRADVVFLVTASRSASFDKMGPNITKCSSWASRARRRTGSFHHSRKSVPCPYPRSLLWNALEYTGVHPRDRNGKTTWKTDNGRSFFSRLLL